MLACLHNAECQKMSTKTRAQGAMEPGNGMYREP